GGDICSRRTLSQCLLCRGHGLSLGPRLSIASSPCGQQGRAHEAVARVTSEDLAFLRLSSTRSPRGRTTPGSRNLVPNNQCCSRDEQDVLVSKLVIDVTGFSRPGVVALRYSHSSQIPNHEHLPNLFVKRSGFHSINKAELGV